MNINFKSIFKGKSSLESKNPLFKRKSSLEARKARAGYVFVAPFVLGILLVYLPILLDSIWFSFSEITVVEGVQQFNYVGFRYYKSAFSTGSEFPEKLLASLQELLLQVPSIIIFSLFIAVVLNQKMLGRAVFRAIFFIPVIISTGLMESINAQDKMSSSNMSGVDTGAGAVDGGDAGQQVLSALDIEALFKNMAIGGQLVDIVVSLVNNIYSIINYSGVQMLIFLAALQSISPSIYEACRIDGATGWETFWKVTFPMISPMILVNTIYTIIDSFTRSKNTMMSYIGSIETSGSTGQFMASAMSWMYFLIVLLILGIVAGISASFIFYQRRD